MVLEHLNKNMEMNQQQRKMAIQYAFDVYKLVFVSSGAFAAGWIASNNATRGVVKSDVLVMGPPTVTVPEAAFWFMAPGLFYFIWAVFPWPGQAGGLSM